MPTDPTINARRIHVRRLVIAPISQKLERVDDDIKLAALLAFLAFPLIELQAALDKQGTTFAHVLIKRFSLATEGIKIHDGDLFLGFAGLIFPDAVNSQPNFGDGSALGCIA